ncbi:MAG: aminotransferase class I/II-fold pyridoxal phosphate-dependent enzyme [Candidatus Halichondribacter symbioticus]
MAKKILNNIWDDIDFSLEKGNNLQKIISRYIKKLVLSGLLKGGDELPSQRNLAKYIGVSLQTMSRVIDDLIEDGYIYTIPRKGMFINEKLIEKKIHSPLEKKSDDTFINLSTNSSNIAINSFNKYLKLNSIELFKEKIAEHQRIHINDFCSKYVGINKKSQNPLLTYGAHQAIFISLLFLKLKYKDLIVLSERITFTPIIKICKSLKIQILYINNTCFSCNEAIRDIYSIKNKTKARKCVLYTVNPLHNPLLHTHSKPELSMIADCIIQNDMFIIEDGAYFFSSINYTSFYDLAPNHTFTILSTSKFLPSMLRLGMLYAPCDMGINSLKTIHESMSWSEPLLETEIFSNIISSKYINIYLNEYLKEIYVRNTKAKEILGEHVYKSEPYGCHILLKNDKEIDILEKSNGKILISRGNSFSSYNENNILFDRVSLISVRDRNKLCDALLKIRNILEYQNIQSDKA